MVDQARLSKELISLRGSAMGDTTLGRKNAIKNIHITILMAPAQHFSLTGKTDTFYIVVQCSVDDASLQDAIEKQADRFRVQNIFLKVLGGHDLCTVLRDHPDVILEFFGRECAKHFFGDTVSQDYLNKLDGGEIQKVISQTNNTVDSMN
jgi:hypothetical protein